MRTTVDLPDSLFRDLKAFAAKRGASLKSVLRMAVEREIRRTEGKVSKKLRFPLLESHDPGTLNLTNAEIDDLSA